MEDVYLDIMQRLGLPGVGEAAVPVGKDGAGGKAALANEYDYWLKMAANIAYAGQKPVPDADAEELALFERTRTRALGDAFDIEAWKAAVTEEEWPKVVYVLNRGGRFASADPAKDDGYEGELIKTRYGGLCAFYDPKTASLKNALTGENFDGLARVAPVALADGTPVEQPADRPFAFINWKARTNGSHRTIAAPWLREVTTENFVWMNPADADARGLANGDAVTIVGPEGEAAGHVRVTEGIRPGVVGANYSFGHQGYGARPVTIDGEVVDPAPDYLEEEGILDGDEPGRQKTGFAGGRGRGFRMNELLPDDPTITGAGGLCDPLGGGAAQFDLWVDVRKA
ncbi:molybdopterin dinucleotide binding domain-containing protein [Eggerthella sp. YY7918]|uniref:molybdopterin dinucleotide binding domain-containing protein n=1 Tax=Eggerthella sp. (strain YY7918) TaxID=502558 RepID=UPI001E5349DF|nr:molybdopterin dinucleotide binding domain-containing protein [Eggerthella sp. YY7918]